jgi:hypothetical protein
MTVSDASVTTREFDLICLQVPIMDAADIRVLLRMIGPKTYLKARKLSNGCKIAPGRGAMQLDTPFPLLAGTIQLRFLECGGRAQRRPRFGFFHP